MDNKVREEVIEWISKPENEEILEMLKQIKDASSKNWFHDLTEGEKESLSKGQKDHQEGNILSSKKFWEKHG